MQGPADDITSPIFTVQVRVHQGHAAGASFLVRRFPAVIGRGSDTDVHLPDSPDDPTLSRRHVRLILEAGRVMLQDLSTNGTWIGPKLMTAGETVPLMGGEEIWLGSRTMITVDLQHSAQAPSDPSHPAAHPRSTPHPAARRPARPGGPHVLEVHAFGSFVAAVDGVTLPPDAWDSRKGIVLFSYLAEQGTQPVSPERLYETIWSDDTGSKQALQTAVSRIRRAFRVAGSHLPDPIRFERGLYGLDPRYSLTYDVNEFEFLCAEARRLHSDADPSHSDRALESALDLYQGAFLEGYVEDWVVRRRMQLENRYFEAMAALGSLRERGGHALDASRIYRRMLEKDPSQEAAHLGLIRCLATTGKRDEAIRQYHDSVRELKRLLNLSPSVSMLQLHQSLTSGTATPPPP